MLEAGAKDILVQDFMKAVKTGMKEITQIVIAMKSFTSSHGKPKREIDLSSCIPSDEIISAAERIALQRITDIMLNWNHDKVSRDRALSVAREEALQTLIVSLTSFYYLVQLIQCVNYFELTHYYYNSGGISRNEWRSFKGSNTKNSKDCISTSCS